jgi:ribosome-associated heat shock protein Hsp15
MSRNKTTPSAPTPRVRLDKWLWAARFFKTRTLASEAITGGRVLMNGQPTKPGKEVHLDARLRIRRGDLTWEVIVLKLSSRRGPAKVAVTLYEETPESVEEREARIEQFRLDAMARPVSQGRPNKAERRKLTELKYRY